MKILYKTLFILIGIGLLQSCSDDDDIGYIPEWDQSTLSYSQETIVDGNDVQLNFSVDGKGMIYYAIYPTGSGEEVTAEGLREEYGFASGPGIDGQLDGGTIEVDGPTNRLISFLGNGDSSYTIYSTSSNEYDYIGNLNVEEVSIICDVDMEEVYVLNSYSDELGVTIDDGYQGTAEFSRVDGTCNQFYTDSLWGEGFVALLAGNPDLEGQYTYPAILTINADNTVDVSAANEEDTYVAGGSGLYDPSTGEVNLEVNQSLFSDSFVVNVRLMVQ
ncbi:hypothetical protein GO491_02035 [Flavobacteriaceae bacterium Ap0902]|nr:hypothetical protein [Flavobacteriaceae bacterium Ap0902]